MPGLQFSSGVDRGFEKDLARMNKKMNSLSKNVQKKGAVMDNTFKTVARSVGGLVSVMAVGAAGKELITFSKDLETALVEVSTISQAVTEDFEGYKNAIIGLSTESATGAKELTDAYYDIVSAGYDGAQGLELLASAERASTAGFVEVGIAADGLTTVLNAWGKSASEATNVSDIFFKTVEKGKTTFPELGQNIAQVAPIAASLGVSFEEVSGAAATLTKSGTPTAQAFTQIRASLLAVNEVLGDGWAEAYTYQEALAEVRNQAGGSTNKLKEMLGRIEAVNAVLGLTGKNASTAASDLEAMNDSLGATETAAEKVMVSTAYELGQLKNNILAALEPLGTQASAAIGTLAKKLAEAFKSGEVQKFAKVVLELVKAFTVYKVSVVALNQVQKIQRSLLLSNITAMRIAAVTGKKVTTGNLLMAKSFKSISAAFKANPIGLIVTGLTLAIPIIKRFAERTREATVDQDDFNRALIDTKEILDSFREIEAGQTIVGLLSASELKEQQQKIKAQLKLEEGLNNDLLIEAKKRLKEDSEVKRLTAQKNNKDLADGLRAFAVNQLKARKLEIIQDLELQRSGNIQRLKDLRKYLKQVEVALEKQPKEKKRKDTKVEEEARKKALKDLEIQNQKVINELNKEYSGRKELERKFHDDMLNQQLIYLEAKRKLSNDELEKLLIDQQILQARLELNPSISKITPKYGNTEVTLRKSSGGKITDDLTASNLDSLSLITDALESTGENITNKLAGLSSSTVQAFETLNSESSNTSDKISGIISLIVAAGEIIKDVVTNAYTKEADELSDVNDEIAKRINSEAIINRLVRERIEMELNSSAFLDANYKESYSLALQTLKDSEAIIDSSINALSTNLVLTATGKGESWLGINETAEDYSFTLDQIIDKSDTLSGIELGGTISNILDPADIFGGASSGKAYIDAFEKVEKAFNSTLSDMGKTAGDMANFSKDEWIEFYTILDESGYIADEGTKRLVDGMREAQEAYISALEEMKNVISTIAGDLGTALGDSIVDSIATGSDALQAFEKDLNKVFLEMAKAEMNQLFFQGMFDQLQMEMEESMAGGDQDWQDDLLRFYDQLPDAISGAEDFMRTFDEQLQDLGLDGVGDGDVSKDLSTAGQISQSITEKTGTILAGHIGAMRLSNERIANYNEDMLDLGVQNLVVMNKIKENTDYLPVIAENTKKTYQKLGGI